MSEQQVKQGRGCFFYGCLTAVILALLVVVAGVIGVRYLLGKVNQFVAQYTETQPMVLPKAQFTAEEAAAVQAQFKSFGDALAKGLTNAPLELDTKGINCLIASSPDFREFKDKVYVTLEGDQVKGQISLPLDKVPLIKGKGRFLNGGATLRVSLQNGALVVTPQDLVVKGQPVPEAFMTQLRGQNLAESATQNPQVADTMRKLESILVKDGRLTITPRAPATTTGTTN
ncbi:MAG: hypothetical protein ABSC03_04955 [Verrucomicrobiota bacterium]|jgi:hypothetical protein